MNIKNNLFYAFSVAYVFFLLFFLISCSGSSESKEKAAGIERFETDGERSYFGRMREEADSKKRLKLLKNMKSIIKFIGVG